MGDAVSRFGPPVFYGTDLSLVDVAATPVLQRLGWLEEVDPETNVFEGFPKVVRARDALLARESVKRSTAPDIVDRFRASPVRGGSWAGRALR